MTTLQVRNVPDDVSRALKARAAEEGQSLSEYALRLLERESRIPTRAELLSRLSERPPRTFSEDAVTIIRRSRDPFSMENIAVETVYDLTTPLAFTITKTTMRRRGVQFTKLNPAQLSQLELFIQKYAQPEEQD